MKPPIPSSVFFVGGVCSDSASNGPVSYRNGYSQNNALSYLRSEALALRKVAMGADLRNFEKDKTCGIGLGRENCKKKVESLNLKTQD